MQTYELQEVIKLSGNRMVLFDNRTHDEGKKAEQVHKLLFLVDKIRKTHHGDAYTDDMYHEIKVKVYSTASSSLALK